jgi:hypothetical protein
MGSAVYEQILTRSQWEQAAARHAMHAEQRTAAATTRRRSGQRHPVEDFLFDYYSLRPSHLARWQPGLAVVLLDGDSWLQKSGYRLRPDIALGAVAVDPGCFSTGEFGTRRQGVQVIARVLRSTRQRPPSFGCFGLHEWAMVYRSDPAEHRHSQVDLRVAPVVVERTVTDVGLRCTHYDAYRFFTSAAVPLNSEQLSRGDQHRHEQPGCIHAGMDLYKWAYKLGPLVSSELLLDCFDHARDARTVDMRASPYDLREWGYDPIAVETTSGRQEYVAEQRRLARAATVLRERLIAVVDQAEL